VVKAAAQRAVTAGAGRGAAERRALPRKRVHAERRREHARRVQLHGGLQAVDFVTL
jgi:hypothetical protein